MLTFSDESNRSCNSRLNPQRVTSPAARRLLRLSCFVTWRLLPTPSQSEVMSPTFLEDPMTRHGRRRREALSTCPPVCLPPCDLMSLNSDFSLSHRYTIVIGPLSHLAGGRWKSLPGDICSARTTKISSFPRLTSPFLGDLSPQLTVKIQSPVSSAQSSHV